MSPILKMARQPTTLCLVLLLLGVAHGFMSSEFSSTRYFTDKGLLPPLKGRGLQPFALNQTSDTATLPYTTDTSSVLSLHGSSVPVTYTNNPKSVYRWLSDNLPYEGCTVGFDVEALPLTRRRGRERSPFDSAATVQLATAESCLVIHLARRSGKHSQACAPILESFLSDPGFVKAGCAIDEDLMALYELWGGLDAKSRLDLGWVGGKQRTNRYGLKTLSKGLLGVDLPKPKEIAVSDWSAVPLTEKQIVYSARDAWAGAAIAAKLAEYDPEVFSHESLVLSLPQVEPSISELVSKQRRRNRAKRDLQRLLAPYPKKHSDLPEKVQAEVRNLRGLIKTRVMEPQLSFEVDNYLVERED